MDIRDRIFKKIADKRFRGELLAEHEGVLSGVDEVLRMAEILEIPLVLNYEEGCLIKAGDTIGTVLASPKEITIAEEQFIGMLAKASGIATAAHKAVVAAEGRVRVVSGAVKKMPVQIKRLIRRAVSSGGVDIRISNKKMLYLDKNYIKMFGSVSAALTAVAPMRDYTTVVQVRGEIFPIEEEVRQAIQGEAGIIMLDTGSRKDLERCQRQMYEMGCRERLQLAYAGGICLEDVPELSRLDVDILCIGKEIIDAGLLDMKFNVLGEER